MIRKYTSILKLLPVYYCRDRGTITIKKLYYSSILKHNNMSLSTTVGKLEDEITPALSSETLKKDKIVQKQKSYNFDKPNKFITKDAENYLRSLKTEYPQLVDFRDDQVVNYLEFMSKYGFRVSKATEMLLKYPPILDDYSTLLSDSLGSWQLLGFSDRQQRKILVRYPQLLTFPRKSIVSRATFLKGYFTGDELHTLIEDNLSVIFDREDIVQQKLEYLIKEASHTSEDISKCKAASHPLLLIKIRHEFLIRSGLFEVIPYQKYYKVMEKITQNVSTAPGGKKFRKKYFTPQEVVCLNDEVFLKVCTKNVLTMNQLAAFEETYTKEYNEDAQNQVYDSADEYEELSETDANSASSQSLRNSSAHFSELEDQNFYY